VAHITGLNGGGNIWHHIDVAVSDGLEGRAKQELVTTLELRDSWECCVVQFEVTHRLPFDIWGGKSECGKQSRGKRFHSL